MPSRACAAGSTRWQGREGRVSSHCLQIPNAIRYREATMNKMPNTVSNQVRSMSYACLLGTLVLCASADTSFAQNPPPADHPAVTVRGQTYTPRSILARNMGSETERVTQFTPHKIIGNIYYVGTMMLSSFLITTPE